MVRLAWPIDYYPFWREESVWPFTHYVLPLALYAATRNVLLTMLFVYVWETLEQILARVGWGRFAGEQWDDSWIGDIFLGLLAAGTFGLVDGMYGWREAVVVAGPPLWARVLLYLAQAAISLMVRIECVPGCRAQVLVFSALHIGLILLVYAPYWANVQYGALIRASTLAWIGVTAAAALLILPVLSGPALDRPLPENMDLAGQGPVGASAYVRMLVLALVLVIVALLLHVSQTLAALA